MANRHKDFEYILGEFQRYYCKGQSEGCQKAVDEYTAWLKALKLDDSKSYGQSRESFQWAKDMITKIKEDAKNVYYKVLVGFPTKSMNRNVYKERDLVGAAHSLVGLHPSVNHKDEYWLSPDNPHNRWGVLTVVGAAPEDGAVEAILQVPKTAICPVCNGGLMTELIDAKRIYNVSLEGQCMNGGGGECDGFQFTEHGFSLLTSDVLPGIPMSKIFPIESFLAFLPTKPTGKHQAIRIIGLKTTEGELSGMTNPDQTVKVTPADANGQCPKGTMWSSRVNGCVAIDDGTATTNFDTTPGGNKAASDLRKARADTGRQQFTPEGTKVVQGSDKYLQNDDEVANRAMGNPKGCEHSDVGIETQTMLGGDKLSKGLSGDAANKSECKTAGDMGKLAGQTHVLVDAGNSDRWHRDIDGQWLIEKGGVGKGDAEKDQNKGAAAGGSPTDHPTSTSRHEQPAYNSTGVCRKGMVWDAEKGMCVFAEDDVMDEPPEPPADQPTNPDGTCPNGMVLNVKTGMCTFPEDTGGEMKSPDAKGLSDNTTAHILPNDAEPNDTSDECGPGLVRDPKTGQCQPKEGATDLATDKSSQRDQTPNAGGMECPDGMVLDSKTGMCVPAECRTAGDMGKLAGATHVLVDQGGSGKWHPDNDDKWLIERIREVQMVANTRKEYDWDQCIADNMKQYGDMDTAKKVCGSIKFQNQSYTQNHELELSQALSKGAASEAQMAQEHIDHDAEVKGLKATVEGLKALVAKHWEAYQTKKDRCMQLEGRLAEAASRIDAQDDKNRAGINERVDLETRLSRRERDLTEALENATRFKKQYEGLQANYEQTEIKYREALKTNLALNKQITKGNEDYLKLAREKEEIEEHLKSAQRMAKHILVKTRI